MFLGGRSQTPLNHSGDFFCPKLCRKEGSKYSMASALEGDCIPGDSKAPGNMPVHSGGGEPYGKCLESWSLLPRVVALICECLRLSELPGAPGCAASWHHCQRHSLVPSESLPWLFQLSACLAACRVSQCFCAVFLSLLALTVSSSVTCYSSFNIRMVWVCSSAWSGRNNLPPDPGGRFSFILLTPRSGSDDVVPLQPVAFQSEISSSSTAAPCHYQDGVAAAGGSALLTLQLGL